MRNRDVRRPIQCLINDAITFGQSNQVGALLFAGVGVQIEMQSNFLEANGHIFGNAERSAKIEIAFGANCRVT